MTIETNAHIVGHVFLMSGSLADFTFFKVEYKKQGKNHNAYINTTIQSRKE